MIAGTDNGVWHSPHRQDSQLAHQPAPPDLTVSNTTTVNQYRYRRLLQYTLDPVPIQLFTYSQQKYVSPIPGSGQGQAEIPFEYDLHTLVLQQYANLIAFIPVCQ
jgi:hypothetical protein